MNEITHEEARQELLRTLLLKVQEDTYPSTTMLDQIEELLLPEEVPTYVMLLQQRIRDDRFPSVPLTQRLIGLL